jgi:hypothetical protein
VGSTLVTIDELAVARVVGHSKPLVALRSSTTWRRNVAGEAILHVRSQRRVRQQLRRLGPPCSTISMPLRRVSTVLHTATPGRSVAAQFARNRRSGTPESARDLPDTLAAGARQGNLFTLDERKVSAGGLRR